MVDDNSEFTKMEFVETEVRGTLEQPLTDNDELIEKAKKQVEYKTIKAQVEDEENAKIEAAERAENGGKTADEMAEEAKDYKVVIADFVKNITCVIGESAEDKDLEFSAGESKMFADGFVEFFGVHFKGRAIAAAKMVLPIIIKTVKHRAKVSQKQKEVEEAKAKTTNAEKYQEGILNAVTKG